MAVALSTHPYGDGAFGALAASVRAAKGGDPLAPVTVVVDRGAVGLSVRRRLAASPEGVANVRFTTWSRLAAELAMPWLSSADRRAVTGAVELEAVRAALDEVDAGPLAALADQPSTVRAVARTYRELAGVSRDALDALAAQSRRSAAVVAIVRAARARLHGAYGPAELLSAAAGAVRQGAVPTPVGSVIVYLPGRAGPAEWSLAEALAARGAVEVIVGWTGDEVADGPARSLLSRLGGTGRPMAMPNPAGGTRTGRTRTWVRSAPSADAEVLMGLRHVMRRNAEGVPLERMAVLHAGNAPYPLLVQDMASMAGIPFHGPQPRQLSATVAGRVLLGVLGLVDRDWRRDDVAAWLSSGPMLHGGRPVPSAEWDALSSDAGVVAGLAQWRDRLAAHSSLLRIRARLVAEAGPGAEDSGERAATLAGDAARCTELWDFVDGLSQRLANAPGTWSGWGSWAARLLADLLGGPARRADWPLGEVAALDAVGDALGSLSALDWIGGPAPGLATFRTALASELERPAPQTARFGDGLLVGRIGDVVGVDLDVVCVVGMVDGQFPARATDDVLVPDREREAAGGLRADGAGGLPADGAGGPVPLRGAPAAEGRREYLAALAGATERVLSYARGDLRTGRELRPARLLLEALSRLTEDGRRLHAGDVRWGPPDGVPLQSFQFVRSFAEAVRDDDRMGEPVSVTDWKLQSLARWAALRRSLDGHFLAESESVLTTAVSVRRARRSRSFTRFDGLVEGLAVPSPADDRPQSATGLETYARCPRRYLFGHLLGLGSRARPETVLQIDPVDRGVLVHGVLERLVAAETADADGARTQDEAQRRASAYAAAAFAGLEQRGLSGHPVLWAVDRLRILTDLRQFLRADAAYRAVTGATPVAVEEPFGWPGDPGVSVEMHDGRRVRFRGRIDRVDALPGGLNVVDYKTGRAVGAAAGEDPLEGGTRLQPAVYALAARGRHGATGTITAGYWHVGGRAEPVGVTLTGALVDRLSAVIGAAVQGIEGGVFPANPGRTEAGGASRAGHCRTCPFDRVCPPDRSDAWGRKHDDPALAPYHRMAEPA